MKVFSSDFEVWAFFASLLICVVSLFGIPLNLPVLLLTKKIIFVIIPTLLGIYLFFRKRIPYFILMLTAILIGQYFINQRLDVISEWVLVLWAFFLVILDFKVSTKITILRILQFLFIMLIITNYLFYSPVRKSLSGLDPNYSALMVYFLFPLFLIERKIWFIFILIVAGILTGSRSFLLASAVFVVSEFLLKLKNRNMSYSLFLKVFLSLFAVLIIYSFIGYNLGLNFYSDYRNGLDRLLQLFNNSSDYYRWEANVIYFKAITIDSKFLIFGSDVQNYFVTKNQFLPHNLVLLELATHGLFGFIFLVMFGMLIKKIYRPEHISFYLGLLAFWYFLGVEVGSIYTVFMISILLLVERIELV